MNLINDKPITTMKNLLFIIALLIPVIGVSQKIYKDGRLSDIVFTITPLVYDPDMDSTITHIDFWQDTTSGVNYEEKIYATVGAREKKKFPDGHIDWPVVGIGFITDYQIGNKVSVIIKIYRNDGTIKTFTYQEKIKNLYAWDEFEWAMYSPDVEVIYDEEIEGL